jgi:uncharacterized membrane protein YeaQ/YmgE (transglycosylase-associated protein family)
MSIIGWLIIGALAGWIASMIMGRNREMNWLENIIAGIVGALIGGFLWGLLVDSDWDSSFSIGTLLVAIVGAVIVLGIWNAVRART